MKTTKKMVMTIFLDTFGMMCSTEFGGMVYFTNMFMELLIHSFYQNIHKIMRVVRVRMIVSKTSCDQMMTIRFHIQVKENFNSDSMINVNDDE
mmetsp:Transcript_24224/g.57311  ORF Transcript_24224/g.57311 Transcript_24224/m.57311 type:complete len:93 (-) Transcript_24224:1447-1725(-)